MILLKRLIHVLSASRAFILAAVFIISVSWLLGSPRALLDEILVRLQDDPTLSSHYDWPVKLQFDAPLELPHINNYPAFARVGVRGSVHWRDDTLTVQLYEVSYAAERNVWFDCKALREIRVGLTTLGFFGADYSVDNPQGSWSAWQPIFAVRSG